CSDVKGGYRIPPHLRKRIPLLLSGKEEGKPLRSVRGPSHLFERQRRSITDVPVRIPQGILKGAKSPGIGHLTKGERSLPPHFIVFVLKKPDQGPDSPGTPDLAQCFDDPETD